MIKKARIELNITQKELARKIGISKSYLNKLENKTFNKSNLNIKVIKSLCAELDICVYVLLNEFYGEDFLCFEGKLNCPLCDKCK